MSRALATVGRWRVANLAVVVVALGIAWLLKAFYSRAGFDELRWILDPTVRLVEVAGAGPFELEAQHGYLCRAHRFEVVPACAGVNFLIAAFVTLCLGVVSACTRARHRVGLLLGAALAAYATTLLANATRIVWAMRLHEAGASFGPFTPERLHRALGVGVYFAFLAALFTLASRVVSADREAAS